MHVVTQNVETAFRELVCYFHDGGSVDGNVKERPSRNGPTLYLDEPVTITYERPLERVLVNAARDVNPAALLYESLWMLAGRNDLAAMTYYTPKFAQYSDDGRTLSGAYGYRWRHATVNTSNGAKAEDRPWGTEWTVDQLDLLVAHLKAQPDSRRAVLQMWNVGDDLLKIGRPVIHPDLGHVDDIPPSKDVCCLSGDTKFRSPEGDADISTLATRFQTQRGYRFPVYTVDVATGDQRLGWMTNAWKTGIRPVLKITFDDGSSLRMTGDHTVFRKRKVYEGRRCTGLEVDEVLAGDLRVGDRLLSELTEQAACRTTGDGYRLFKRNLYRNTGFDNMVKEHRDYYTFVTGAELVEDQEIHHKNEVKNDNRFENLEVMTASDHGRYHKSKSNPHTHMAPADRKKRGRIHSAVLLSGGKENTPPHIREILKQRPPKRTEEQNETLWDWVSSLSNHKIVSIEKAGSVVVYDFTVPGRHNAVLSNGVVVHNCNTACYFSSREDPCPRCNSEAAAFIGLPCSACDGRPARVLDITVTNRSNDLIWGALGANYVTFSVLLEYMAARLGWGVGRYHHFSNNLHVYQGDGKSTARWEPDKWLADTTPSPYDRRGYSVALVKDPAVFQDEMSRFVEHHAGQKGHEIYLGDQWEEPFLELVAHPLLNAFHAHKRKDREAALSWAGQIRDDAWRQAMTGWLGRRYAKKEAAGG